MNVIELKNVSKIYKKGEKFNSLRDSIPALFRSSIRQKLKKAKEDREFLAVNNVTFNIKKGEVVGIMGPNGAGKSTILKLLSRIIVPNEGTMTINGRLSALIEVTAGFHPELTGRENVYLNGTILGMKRKEIDFKFNEIVEFSGIGEFIDTPVKRYSSGMYSRLGFSVAAHMDPDILLVDEVLSVGDMAFRAQCGRKMRELLSSGTTIVLVSHQLSLIKSLCKRVILLQQGKVIKDGDVDEVIPFYQNIVLEKTEADFRKKSKLSSQKVKLDEKTIVSIPKVSVVNGDNEKKDKFIPGDPISIRINYDAHERIEQPNFLVEIIRSDGVSCCSSNSKDQSGFVNSIEGCGSIKVDFGKINLAAGVYMARVSIWDKDMLHPYLVRDEDVIRISDNGEVKHTNSVFIPKVEWSNNNQ